MNMARFTPACTMAMILLMAISMASPDNGPVDLLASLFDPHLPLPKDTSLESHIVEQAKEFPSKLDGLIAFVGSLTTAPVAVDKLAETRDQWNASFTAIKQINEKIRMNPAVAEKLPRDDCFSQVANELGNQANASNTLIDQVQGVLKCHLADKCYRSINDSVLKTKTVCETTLVATTKFYENVVGRCLSQMPAASERLQKAAPELIDRLSISLAYKSLVAEFINSPLCNIYSAKFSWPIEPKQWRQTIIAQLIRGGTTTTPPTTTTTLPKVLAEPKCAVDYINFVQPAPLDASGWNKCMDAHDIISANIFQVSLSPRQHTQEQIILAGATIVLQLSRLMMMTNPIENNIEFSDKGKPDTMLRHKWLRPAAVQVSSEITFPFISIPDHLRGVAFLKNKVPQGVTRALKMLSETTLTMIHAGLFDREINSAIENLQKGTELLGKVSGNFEKTLTLIEELYENIALSHSTSATKLTSLRQQHQASLKRVAEDASKFNKDFQDVQGHLKAIDSDVDALVSGSSGAWLTIAIGLRNDLSTLADSSIPWPAISPSSSNQSPGNIDGSQAGKMSEALFGMVVHAYGLILSDARPASRSPTRVFPESPGTSDDAGSKPGVTKQVGTIMQSHPVTAAAAANATSTVRSPAATTRMPLPKTKFTKSLDKFTSLTNKVAQRLNRAVILSSITGVIEAIQTELPYVEVNPASSNSAATVSDIACRAKHFALVGTSLWNKPPLSQQQLLRCQRAKNQVTCEKNRVGLELLQADIITAESLGKRYTSDASKLITPAEDAAKINLKSPGVANALNALEEIVSAVGEIDLQAARLTYAYNALSTVLIFSIQQDVLWIKKLPTLLKDAPIADQEFALNGIVGALKQKLNRASDFATIMGGTADVGEFWQDHVAQPNAGIIKWIGAKPKPGEDPTALLKSAIEDVKNIVKTQQDGLDGKIKDAKAKIETVIGILGKPTQTEKEFVANAFRSAG